MTVNPMDLTGKRILVTGASSGIGKTTAQILSNLGARVVLLARNQERLHQTLKTLNGEGHSVYPFDLANVDGIPSMMRQIAQEGGQLSGLFHSAGLYTVLPVSIIKAEYIDPVMNIGLKAGLLLTKGFCQKTVRTNQINSIVLMSSIAGLCGVKGLSIYSASKAAIDGAVRALACELAPRNIRINSIAGGAVETRLHNEAVKNLSESEVVEYRRKHLLDFGRPEDIGYATAFLLSDAAKWITGTTMIVDGGYCCA